MPLLLRYKWQPSTLSATHISKFKFWEFGVQFISIFFFFLSPNNLSDFFFVSPGRDIRRCLHGETTINLGGVGQMQAPVMEGSLWSGLACLLDNSVDPRTYSASVLTITLILLFPSTGAGILVVFPFFLRITLSWSLPKSLTYVLFSMLSSILIPVHMESLFSSVWFTVIIRRSLSVASSLFNRISK